MVEMKTAAILTIGDELMIGQIVDTNSAWIASWLDLRGWKVTLKMSVGDDIDGIVEAITLCHNAADLVITSGGLGPTNDDLTAKALARYYDCKLVWHEETWTRMLGILNRMNRSPSELHKTQCFLPEKATILPNDRGSAPGMFFRQGEKMLISLPGVPHEMKHILGEKIKNLIPEGQPVEHRFIRTCGEGETVIAEMISDIEESLKDIRLAYLPSFSQVTLRLTGYGDKQKEVIEGWEQKIIQRLGSLVYGSGTTTLSQAIGELLRQRNETVAAGESCTGGYISHLLTSVPGASDYYIGSIVPYAYRMKTSELNISEETLLQYGAVSKEVVTLMAEGVRHKLGVTWSVATSGIAGPTGGTPDKPVGTIWIACAGPQKTETRLLRLTRDRISNIEYTGIATLVLLRKCILELPPA
jgi:nicotinamide-nucleotide amidase